MKLQESFRLLTELYSFLLARKNNQLAIYDVIKFPSPYGVIFILTGKSMTLNLQEDS